MSKYGRYWPCQYCKALPPLRRGKAVAGADDERRQKEKRLDNYANLTAAREALTCYGKIVRQAKSIADAKTSEAGSGPGAPKRTRQWEGLVKGKKILMLAGEFSEEYEIFVFEQAMSAVGHVVHVVCPGKKAGEQIQTSLHDFEGGLTYTEKPGHLQTLNATFAKIDPEKYDAVYVAGGRGPEYIRINKDVQKIVKHFHDAKKPIFTICHGVQVLMAVKGVITGKHVAALEYCEPEVTAVGGIYVDVPPTGAHVDGNLVSAKGWPGLAAFMRECLAVLGTKITHS
jgi:protease I